MAEKILKGKALRSDTDTLEEAGVTVSTVAVATAPVGGEGEGGGYIFTQVSKLMLVGSTPSEVEMILKGKKETVGVRNDLGGMAVPKGYKRVALNDPAGPADNSPYR